MCKKYIYVGFILYILNKHKHLTLAGNILLSCYFKVINRRKPLQLENYSLHTYRRVRTFWSWEVLGPGTFWGWDVLGGNLLGLGCFGAWDVL
jgi:hypothetical protein